MRQLTRWEKILIFVICFSLTSSVVCAAPMPLTLNSGWFNPAGSIIPDGRVTLVIETESPAVLSGDISLMGDISGGEVITKEEEKRILEEQNDIAENIQSKTGAKLIHGQQYTLLFNGFAVEAQSEDIEKIKAIDGVKSVYVCNNIRLEPHLMDSVGMISAMPEDTGGYTGKGQLIAIIDNEFDVTHPFFSQTPPDIKYTKEDIEDIVNSGGIEVDASLVYVNEKIPFAYNYADESYDLSSSTLSHGTHVAGIAAGNTTDVDNVKGVAHNSQLALMRVSSESGIINDTAVIRALEDAVKLGACAINISIGADYASTYTMPLMEECFNNIRNAGILVSASAGNRGKGFYENSVLARNIDYSSMGAVASFNSTFSVGAVNKLTADGVKVADYSGYGVSEDLILNPDIAAPGSYIYSSLSGGAYGKMRGTSMAAPHIAGAYAAACEYYEEKFPDLTGKQRLELIEKQFMSTAIPARNQDFVYTPRVQGAGVLKMASALETPVVLKGNGGKTKINLGSGIGNDFSLCFKAENISASDAEYDVVSMELVADDYSLYNGQYIVSGTRGLEFSHNLPEKVVISSGEEIEFSVDVSIDSGATADLSNVFTNGFFIDGFVYLKKSDSSLPELSIPFMGFYGDWTKAPIFDTTIYDEYGSALNDASVGGASLLYSTEQGYNIVLGSNGNGGYNSKYNAISPNGDTMQDELKLQFTPLRAFKLNNVQIVDSDGDVKSNTNYGGLLFNKFNTRSVSFGSNNLADGDYHVRMKGVYNYPAGNPAEQMLDVPFYVDTQLPQIPRLTRQKNNISLSVKDNKYVSHAYTYYIDSYGNVNTKRLYITEPQEGQSYNLEFDLADIGAEEASMEEVYVFVHDMAGNYYVNSVAQLSGKFYPRVRSMSYENHSFNMRLGIKNFTDSDQNCDLLLAFYDNDGKLLAMKWSRNFELLTDTECGEVFILDADIDTAVRCSLFIWENSGKLAPLDTVKDIDISEIIIN